MKKLFYFTLSLLLIVTLSFLISSTTEATTSIKAMSFFKKEAKIKDFNQKNIYKAYKKTGETMVGKAKKTKVATIKSISVRYTIKNKNHALMYAQKDAQNYLKTITKKVKSPSGSTSLTIYFIYDYKNEDKQMFRVILDKTSFTNLKKYKGDFTKLDKKHYLIEPNFGNL